MNPSSPPSSCAAHSSSDWLGLRAKVCVVTGAASGIGAAVAAELVAAGAHVALLDRNAEAVQTVAQQLTQRAQALASSDAPQPPSRVLGLACDVSDESAVQAAAQQIEATLGPAWGLVNNAGLLRAGALEAVSLADWNHVLGINLTGYLLCARALREQMLAQGGGSLVHVASIAALHPQTRSGAYSASKAGVLLLSRQMAAEWGPQGLRSNAICPGMIRTALSAKFYEEPGFEARRAAVTASRRVGEPIDIANAALFLLSPRAGYLNGAELVVDGGMDTMLMDLVPRPGFNTTAAPAAATAPAAVATPGAAQDSATAQEAA